MINIDTKKHPLENNEKLSIAYALAFAEPTSKHQIQKHLTKSARYEQTLTEFKDYFIFTDRQDKRLGKYIQSKPEILIELIKTKTKFTKNEEEQIMTLLNDPDFKSTLKNDIKPLRTEDIINALSTIFLGYFITEQYRKYKKSKQQVKLINMKTRRDRDLFYRHYANVYNALLPGVNIFKNPSYRNIIDKFENIGGKLSKKFKYQTVIKLLHLNPQNAITILYCNTAFALAETYNFIK